MRREPFSFAPLGALLLGASVTVALGACGSRSPLDTEATNVSTSDAAADEGRPSSADATAPEAAKPPVDAGRDATASAISCGTCVLTTCGSKILGCLQSEPCRAVFQCVTTTCLASGGDVDPICLFQCAKDDPAGALGVLAVFDCITKDCGADCGALLGGLGGIPGGGKQGASGKAGNHEAEGAESETLREILSPWPALFSRDPRLTERAR
ncbi:MAG TPA: hypothetical protein VM925_32380 [Labilithrix sp.]|nr:hypothetical protein [Labilithrix sp.]